MSDRSELLNTADLFLPLSQRPGIRGPYFVRIDKYSATVRSLIWRFHEAARARGVIIEGQLNNPDDKQLRYFQDMLGSSFDNTPVFIADALSKWMPRMPADIRASFAGLLCKQLSDLSRAGKSDCVLRNIYSKILCWLYYKMDSLMTFLGKDELPRILYQCGKITFHELILLRIMNAMGVDILLVEPAGDEPYLALDPSSSFSQLLKEGSESFPAGFSLQALRKEMASPVPGRPSIPRTPSSPAAPSGQRVSPPGQAARDPAGHFKPASVTACTNAWMEHPDYHEILTPPADRGKDTRFFYNACIRVSGVEDKLTYLNELYRFYQSFTQTGRNIVIAENALFFPGNDEIQRIDRRQYHSAEELIIDLAANLPASADLDLQRMMQQAFVKVMKEASLAESKLNRLLNDAVYLLCRIQHYQTELFTGYKNGVVPCFILLGGCRDQRDAMYLKYLMSLPVDVLILTPDLSKKCVLKDDRVLDIAFQESMQVTSFPENTSPLRMSTAAANAEQDLDPLLYSDAGMFRNRQFAQANAITLKTTYDELFILWDQELQFRSNFSVTDRKVNMPVIYAKISGVEKGDPKLYWQKIGKLLTPKTILLNSLPLFPSDNTNLYRKTAISAIRDGKISRETIKSMDRYPFALLREELQEHLFDKIQMMLDQKIIKGTFVNGTEYTVLATILSMNKELIPYLQSFDFTKVSPKIVVINTGENSGTQEDAILLTFFNLIGFDIILFVPTGYRTIERFLETNLPEEHQAGDYLYDLTVPDLQKYPTSKFHGWLRNIIKRGK